MWREPCTHAAQACLIWHVCSIPSHQRVDSVLMETVLMTFALAMLAPSVRHAPAIKPNTSKHRLQRRALPAAPRASDDPQYGRCLQ
jgi:hypothetical protein